MIVCPCEIGYIFFRAIHRQVVQTCVAIDRAESKRLSTDEVVRRHFQVKTFALNGYIYNTEHSQDFWQF